MKTETGLTKKGTRFSLMRAATEGPAPLLLTLAGTAEDALTHEIYGRTGEVLRSEGWCIVSMDLPCHGADRRAGEPEGLTGWRARVDRGEDIVAAWQSRVSDLLTHLVEARIADPNRIVADGTSRGGFMALHAAAGDARIRVVAAYAPVTDLLTLREFAGKEGDALTQRLALHHVASRLADRGVWIVIGCADLRVGTDKAIALAGAVVTAAGERGLRPDVTLLVLPVSGHTSVPAWHDLAVEWLREQNGPPDESLSSRETSP